MNNKPTKPSYEAQTLDALLKINATLRRIASALEKEGPGDLHRVDGLKK